MRATILGRSEKLPLSAPKRFYLRDTLSKQILFEGVATKGKEEGFNYRTPQATEVLELDFSQFNRPGTYTLGIKGLGESDPFPISSGYYACLARTYALGIYHQRCGASVGMPFSCNEHSPCHTHPALIPTTSDKKTWELIRGIGDSDHEDQTAPSLESLESCLFPARRSGEIDVSGGHHDAGDYSKYVTNSAQFVHTLTYAVDNFDGVSEIDNLGIPESGNGIPDALDLAAWEASFLAKMQDSDGGFFFLVYPRNRSYETDVTPDKGDKQAVFPKNTASTAARGGGPLPIGHIANIPKTLSQTRLTLSQASRHRMEVPRKRLGKVRRRRLIPNHQSLREQICRP